MYLDRLDSALGDGQLGDAEIGHVLEQRLDDSRPIASLHQQLNIGELPLELGENLGQNVDAGGLVGRDHQLPARRTLQFADGVLRLAPQAQDLLGVLAEDLPRSSERDAAAEALKERRIEFLLQLPHLGADGRLGAVAGLRRLREALQPNDLKKRVELVEIHSCRSGRSEPKVAWAA